MIEPLLLAITAAILAAAVVFLAKLGRASKRARLHRKNITTASAVLEKLRSWQPGSEGAILAYLRKINPMVFEEVILTCFEDSGAKIIRNRRYTNDGGVDGKFIFNGNLWMIQAKRYSSAINPRHVREFARQCKDCKGVFVHTGRTGLQSYRNLEPNIQIVSGRRLIHLIRNHPIEKIICGQTFRQQWIQGNPNVKKQTNTAKFIRRHIELAAQNKKTTTRTRTTTRAKPVPDPGI